MDLLLFIKLFIQIKLLNHEFYYNLNFFFNILKNIIF